MAETIKTNTLLSKKEESLIDFLFKNIERPEFAVARRQQFDKVLGIVRRFGEHINKQVNTLRYGDLETQAYQYLATGLFLAATGHLTREQLHDPNVVLTPQQVQDCLQLATLYEELQFLKSQLQPRPMSVQPVPGEPILVRHHIDLPDGRPRWLSSIGLPYNTDEFVEWLPFPAAYTPPPTPAVESCEKSE